MVPRIRTRVKGFIEGLKRFWSHHKVGTTIACGLGLAASLASILSGAVDLAELRRRPAPPPSEEPAACTDLEPKEEWLLLRFESCIDKERDAAEKRIQFYRAFFSIEDVMQEHREGRGPDDLEAMNRQLDTLKRDAELAARSLASSAQRQQQSIACFEGRDYKLLGDALSGERVYICDQDLKAADLERIDAYKGLSNYLKLSPLDAQVVLDRIERAEADYFRALQQCLEFSKRHLCQSRM